MAQDPQNQFYPDNNQPQYNNNTQSYDNNGVYPSNYVDPNQSQGAVYQYPVDGSLPVAQTSQQYDPNLYYQPQPNVQPVADAYQYGQPIANPSTPTGNYQDYSQQDPYSQNYNYPVDTTLPVDGYNSNPDPNNFEQPISNYQTELPQTNSMMTKNQSFDYNQNPGFEVPAIDQTQYNNFDSNYDPENQFDPHTTDDSMVHEGGFFSNKRNLVIIGLIVLMVGLISASGILFYLRSQENNSAPISVTNISESSSVSVTAPTTTTPKTTVGGTAVSSSQTGRAVAVGTTDTGGVGTPATNAKKTSVTKLSIEWIKGKFSTDVLNEDGSCKAVLKCGEKADPDNDGLLNIEEFNFQTDPLNPDTDNDGFADGDEVKVYYTDPTKKDSDNDTYEDGDEITNCYDPITATSNKLAAARKSQVNSIVATVPLHKSTIDKLKKAGATTDDITEKGYIAIKCGASTTNSETLITKPNKTNS